MPRLHFWDLGLSSRLFTALALTDIMQGDSVLFIIRGDAKASSLHPLDLWEIQAPGLVGFVGRATGVGELAGMAGGHWWLPLQLRWLRFHISLIHDLFQLDGREVLREIGVTGASWEGVRTSTRKLSKGKALPRWGHSHIFRLLLHVSWASRDDVLHGWGFHDPPGRLLIYFLLGKLQKQL